MILREQDLKIVLGRFMTEITAASALRFALGRARVRLAAMRPGDERVLLAELERGVQLFLSDARAVTACVRALRESVEVSARPAAASASSPQVHCIPVNDENDIVKARTCAREICAEAGFASSAQIRFTTVVSELSRNIVQYAGHGEVNLSCQRVGGHMRVEVRASDEGPGIANLDEILEGRYRSKTGLGRGLVGARGLVDEFDVQTRPGHGTQVVARMSAR